MLIRVGVVLCGIALIMNAVNQYVKDSVPVAVPLVVLAILLMGLPKKIAEQFHREEE